MKFSDLFIRFLFAGILSAIEGVESVYNRVRLFMERNFTRCVLGAIVLGVLFGLTCCATANEPFVVSYAVNPSKYPFSRPSPVTLSVGLYNPFDHAVEAEVYCPGNIFDGHSWMDFTVAPHGDTHFLAEVMSTDQFPGACHVEGWHFVGLPR